jgi:tripeptide aminopeptidase
LRPARFLRYVQIDIRAEPTSSSCPSSPGQWNLARLLEHELREIGAAEVTLTEHGDVLATLPATVRTSHP